MVKQCFTVKSLLQTLNEPSANHSSKSEAMNVLYLLYSKRITSICRRVAKDRLPADRYILYIDDLISDVFEMLLKKPFIPNEGDSEDVVENKFFAWVYKVARNLCSTSRYPQKNTISITAVDEDNSFIDCSQTTDPVDDTTDEFNQTRKQREKLVAQEVRTWKKPRDRDVYYKLIKPYGGDLGDVSIVVKKAFIKKWGLSGFSHLRSLHNDVLKRLKKLVIKHS